MSLSLERMHSNHLFANWMVPRCGVWVVLEHWNEATKTWQICEHSVPVDKTRSFVFTIGGNATCGHHLSSSGFCF
jgi:hypothetical protein